jgi:hypothetical protein
MVAFASANEENLIRSLAYIEAKTEEYIKELEICDGTGRRAGSRIKKERKDSYKDSQDKLSKRDEKQISLVGQDSRPFE